jgi:hypothetical protein
VNERRVILFARSGVDRVVVVVVVVVVRKKKK